MLEINTLDDIAALRESLDIECKLAQGRDGKGALPKDMYLVPTLLRGNAYEAEIARNW